MARKPRSKVPQAATQGGKYCGAKTRAGGRCGQRAGWGTDHPGTGRCKLHGGATPIKHGRYAQIPRGRLAEKLEEWRKVERADLKDLTDQLQLVRAVLETAVEDLAHAPSDAKAEAAGKTLGEWTDRLTRLVDTVERIERGNRFVVSTDDAERLLERVADLVSEYLTDERADEFVRRLAETA